MNTKQDIIYTLQIAKVCNKPRAERLFQSKGLRTCKN